jgi:hypothetical protein
MSRTKVLGDARDQEHVPRSVVRHNQWVLALATTNDPIFSFAIFRIASNTVSLDPPKNVMALLLSNCRPLSYGIVQDVLQS